MSINFNELRDQCHNAAVKAGWWTKKSNSALFPEYTIEIDIRKLVSNLNETTPYMGQILALIHSEISEATIACIYPGKDEHLPQRHAYEVELADIVIRILDLLGALSVDIDYLITKYKYTHPATTNILLSHNLIKLTCVHTSISKALESYRKNTQIEGEHGLINILVKTIIDVFEIANRTETKLLAIIQEKLAYNVTRLDHKATERNQPHGKKF